MTHAISIVLQLDRLRSHGERATYKEYDTKTGKYRAYQCARLEIPTLALHDDIPETLEIRVYR
jgi:hypothetical protein